MKWDSSCKCHQDQKGAYLNSIHEIWILILLLVWRRKGSCLSQWPSLLLYTRVLNLKILKERDGTQLNLNKGDAGWCWCFVASGLSLRWVFSSVCRTSHQRTISWQNPVDNHKDQTFFQLLMSNPWWIHCPGLELKYMGAKTSSLGVISTRRWGLRHGVISPKWGGEPLAQPLVQVQGWKVESRAQECNGGCSGLFLLALRWWLATSHPSPPILSTSALPK